MNHEQYKEQLSALLDGELNEREREETLAHLASCEACQQYFAALNAMHDALSEPEDYPVPENFAAGVMARLHEEPKLIRKQSPWREEASAPPERAKTRRPWRGFAAMAACAAVVVLAVTVVPRIARGGGAAAAPEMTMAIQSAATAAPAAPVAPPDSTRDYDGAEEAASADGAYTGKTAGVENSMIASPAEPEPPVGASGVAPEARAPGDSGVAVDIVTSGPNGEPAVPEMNGAGIEGPSLALTLYGEGAEEWLAEHGFWSEADDAWVVDNEVLDLLPEGLTLRDDEGVEEDPNLTWHFVRVGTTEAAP
ncbi:MAG: hypothetical protein E7474_00735 [Ruminococcaceae bacterium]|nr:hypothetical protein [Oscillospiraceae bacterium]